MYQLIAGVDEAGRGPWAGPVTVAAVILNPQRKIPKLNDSKQLSEKMREVLFDDICNSALAVSVVSVSSNEIDVLNIREATLLGMLKAVQGLSIVPDHVLIDGRDVPKGLGLSAEAIISGDALIPEISAASIIAKVMRDRIMVKLSAQYPQYGFAQHKGYGTQLHAKALAEFGPCRVHRQSFAPIRTLYQQM